MVIMVDSCIIRLDMGQQSVWVASVMLYLHSFRTCLYPTSTTKTKIKLPH